MNVMDSLVAWLSDFVPVEYQFFLTMMAGAVFKFFFLLLIAGWALVIRYRCPSASRRLLVAIALTAVWEGAPVFTLIAYCVEAVCQTTAMNADLRGWIVSNLWWTGDILLKGTVWACVLTAAFGTSSFPGPHMEESAAEGGT